MEDTRFDTITKTLGALTTRRVTAGALLAGAFGVLGLAESDDAGAAESGKCKPKCGSCAKCDKGECEKKNGKKRCKKGKCKPKPNGTLCAGGTCQSGECICLGLQQTCVAPEECCPNTTCGHPVETQGNRCCQTASTACTEGTASTCCTGICDPATNRCFCKTTGQSCDSNSQCCSDRCVNSLCA